MLVRLAIMLVDLKSWIDFINIRQNINFDFCKKEDHVVLDAKKKMI